MRHDIIRERATLRRTVPRRTQRTGFTLVELLVVIGIILLIAAITASAVNIAVSGDRVRGAGRQVQSYLEGARSRAVYGGNIKTNGAAYQCGVRFIPDANNNHLVTSMIYVEAQADENTGTITIGRRDGGPNYSTNPPDGVADSTDARIIRGYGTRWRMLYQNGLIFNGARIRIPGDSSGRYYAVDTSELAVYPGFGPEILILTTDFIVTPTVAFKLGLGAGYSPSTGPDGVRGTTQNDDNLGPADDVYEWQWPGSDDMTDILAFSTTFSYQLELAPQPMANQDPRVLGNGVVLDLNLSKGLGYLLTTPNRMDIMFSPRGTVIGPLSGTGMVEFVLSDREDSIRRSPLSSSLWQPSHTYAFGQAVVPSAGRNGYIYQLTSPTSGGASGSMEPATWPTTPNTTVTDGSLTWTCLASTDGNTSSKHERLIVTLTPQTGMTAVHPVYVSQTLEDADPYRYAETGEVARQ